MLNKRIFIFGLLLTLAASGVAIGQSTTRRTKAKPKTTARTQSKPPSSVTTKKPSEPFFDHYETDQNVKTADAAGSSNALPEPDDEVLTRTGQTQAPKTSPAAIDPRTGKPFLGGAGDGQSIRRKQPTRPFQEGSGDGQSIRRKHPARPSVNPDRPTTGELAVENPNAQPTKNATTRPKIKQDPDETGSDKKPNPDGSPAGQAFTGYLKIEGVKDATVDTPRSTQTTNGQTSRTRRPSTQTQRPPNGPVGKPKRPVVKPIRREPIENPVDIGPPASSVDLSKQKKPSENRMGNFEIQRVKQNRDMEITMAQDGTRAPARKPANVAAGDINRDGSINSARAAAPTEEIRFDKAAVKPVTAPKRKPATRRTVRKPN